MKAIEVRALTKRFRRVTAVDGVSLDVEPGSVYALIGFTGAAKAWIANRPAELVGAMPVNGEPGVVRLQVRVPAEGVPAGAAPLFVAEGGLQSNGIAITVR
ncbi:MAG: hypothetical protein FJW31_08590 [Acidobacteria bacterium]|nr:hypothetical protein [Acidobacteriota bacterium]